MRYFGPCTLFHGLCQRTSAQTQVHDYGKACIGAALVSRNHRPGLPWLSLWAGSSVRKSHWERAGIFGPCYLSHLLTCMHSTGGEGLIDWSVNSQTVHSRPVGQAIEFRYLLSWLSDMQHSHIAWKIRHLAIAGSLAEWIQRCGKKHHVPLLNIDSKATAYSYVWRSGRPLSSETKCNLFAPTVQEACFSSGGHHLDNVMAVRERADLDPPAQLWDHSAKPKSWW